MEKIAVICCSNNEDILKTMLIPGLDLQKDVLIEKHIYINEFESAAKAYNYAIKNTKAEYLVFVHQDIRFKDEMLLAKLIQNIKTDTNCVFGLCGSKKISTSIETYSNVYHGLQNKFLGTQISEPIEVNGLDEIFVGCHRNIFSRIAFDEINFDGWHLFVEDLCIQAQLNNIKVKVLPYYTEHKNILEMPKYMMVYKLYPDDYFIYLKRIRNKYKNKIDAIVCPCISISTHFISFYKKYIITRCKMNFYRFLRKISMK